MQRLWDRWGGDPAGLEFFLRRILVVPLLCIGLLLGIRGWPLYFAIVYALFQFWIGCAVKKTNEHSRSGWRYAQLVTDLVAFSVAVASTGCLTTIFLIFYPVFVCVVTIAWGVREGFIAQLATTLSYWLILALTYTGIIDYSIFYKDHEGWKPLLAEHLIWAQLPGWSPFVVGGILLALVNYLTYIFVSKIVYQRIQSDSRLRYNVQTFQNLTEGAPVGIFRTDPQGGCVYANTALCDMMDCTYDDLLGQGWALAILEPDRQRMLDAWADATQRQRIFASEFRVEHTDGNIVWLHCHATPEKDPGDNLLGYIGTVADISERRRAENLLAGVAEAARALLTNPVLDDAIGQALGIIGEAAMVARVAVFESHPHPKSGKKVFSYIYEWCASGAKSHIRDSVFRNMPHYLIEATPWYPDFRAGKMCRVYRRDVDGWIAAMMDAFRAKAFLLVPLPVEGDEWCGIGFHAREERIWTEQEEALLRASALSLYGAIQRNRYENERVRMERHLMEGQKAESLGVLAGGLAHDFNNLLMTMQGNIHLALSDLPESSSARGSIESIRKACVYAGDLIGQLLDYAGKRPVRFEPTSLNAIVEDMTHLVRPTLAPNIALEAELVPNLPLISSDPGQLRQVVVNLITNAADSIEMNSGKIRLVSGQLRPDALFLQGFQPYAGLEGYPCVFLRISDTGKGMDEATCRKIFDPFFTTKPRGRGLGLAAVLGIVRAHRGSLHVTSEPGQGTEFTLLFPQAIGVMDEVPEGPVDAIVPRD